MTLTPAIGRIGSAAAVSGIAIGVLLGLGSATKAGVARSGAETAQPATQPVLADDLAVRVPAEWRRLTGNEHNVYMVDPRHSNRGMTFSIFTDRASAKYGLIDEGANLYDQLRSDSAFSHVTARNVHLSGVHAFECTFRVKIDNDSFFGRKYVVVHHGRWYVVTYEGLPEQAAAHAAQIKASVSSLRYTRGPYDPDIRTVVVAKSPAGMLSFRISFRHPTKLTGPAQLQVMLDTDRKLRTGVQGAEYALDYLRIGNHAPSAALITVHGKNSITSKPKSLRFRSTPTSATFQIASKALDKPATFGFRVFAARGDAFIDEVPLKGVAVGQAEWIYPPLASKIATVRYNSP